MGEHSRAMNAVARDLRQRQTRSEILLWSILRDRQTLGRKFRRQHAIGCFVVDFFCAEAQLAVEIDGPIHNFQQAEDMEQQLIESLGVRFLRVTAEQVESNLAAVLEIIREELTNKA